MIEHNNGQIPYLSFEQIADDRLVEHAIFTRQGGVSPAPYNTLNLSVSVDDEESNVYSNRSLAYGLFNRSNQSLIHAYLCHGADVAQVSQQDNGRYIGPVDGLISNDPGCGLTMNYADCAPIILTDPEHRAIGIGHAGWKGAVKDLPGALVRAMQEAFGSNPANLNAAIGPCIGPCCYEIGEPVLSSVRSSFPRATELLLGQPFSSESESPEERMYFDLPQANNLRLVEAGVEKIELSGLCTACRTDLFYSHRAEMGRTGRFGVILILNP